MSLLEIDRINTLYGNFHVLFDLSIRVEQGEVVALLGRNGAGKTTTLRSIMGVLAPNSGQIGWMASRLPGCRRRRSPTWAFNSSPRNGPSSAA